MSNTLGYLFQINVEAIEDVIKQSGRVDHLDPFFVNLIARVMHEKRLYETAQIGRENNNVTRVLERHLDSAFDYLQIQIQKYM